ncbi:MAG TPA: GNAT family N-acetyltransferase [Pseudomonas sp.]
MDINLRPATVDDLKFARELTRVNMREYYAHHSRVWQGEAFDSEWAQRQSLIVNKAGKAIGYISLTTEPGYLYLRDVQLCEPFRGEGIGTWVLRQVEMMALDMGTGSVRLKVFKNNPAIDLYRRHGYCVIGQETALYWMELTLPTDHHSPAG